MLGKDLLVKILNCRFGLNFVEILNYFEKWEVFEFEYSHQFQKYDHCSQVICESTIFNFIILGNRDTSET